MDDIKSNLPSMHILNDFDLTAYNTLAVPSLCKHYCEVSSVEELKQAIVWATKNNLSHVILGAGSNVLLSQYIDALVIRPLLMGIRCVEKGDRVWVTAGAGECWHDFVMFCLSSRWYGLENLVLIPGLVGAAPIQNIGAYGVEVKDIIRSVRVLNTETLSIEELASADCRFAYRDSIFKKREKNRYVILEVTFDLSESNKICISYRALLHEISRLAEGSSSHHAYHKKKVLSQNSHDICPEDVAEAVISLRKSKLPNPVELPNSGSFFKNPVISIEKYVSLNKKFPTLVAYNEGFDKKKLAAGWLIEKAGWKGKNHLGVYIHEHQALVITNPNNKPLSVILDVVRCIQNDVNEMFDVSLEVEPQYLV